MFDRKHYFYADLPTGYQITQQRAPLANKGSLSFPVFIPGVTKKPYYKTVRLHQLQLEQDSGKSLHDEAFGVSLIDLNRAGVPLMELVFEPDLTDGEEAAALVKELVLILTSLGTCNCRMEEGSLRVDANISIHEEGQPLGTRTEVKNIGSVRGVAQAVAFEIERQKAVRDGGGRIINETRSWDAESKTTISMRDKEVMQDYRFMPEPNLPPLHLNLKDEPSEDLINVVAIHKTLPAMPQELRDQLIAQQVPQEAAIILVNEPTLLQLFNETISEKRPSKQTANIIINELLTSCHKNKVDIENCPIKADRLGQLIDMLESQVVNLNLARLIVSEMFEDSRSPQAIAEAKNWKQITDDADIEKFIETILTSDGGKQMVAQYKAGKTKVIGAIAGEINKKSDNRVNMAKAMSILKVMLSK